MPPVRVYSQLPALAEIQKINGPIVIEQSNGNSFTAQNVGVLCVVGETLKGPPNVPTEVTLSDLIDTFGGFNPYVGDGAAYGYDGSVFMALAGGGQASRLVVVAVEDRVGQVTLSREAPGYATLTSTNVGPFTLADGDTFTVAIEGPVTDGTATIQAEACSVESSNAETFNLTTVGNRTLTLAVNGGPAQSATITTGDVSNIAAVTAEEIAAWANAAFTGVSVQATSTGTKVTFTTDREGLSASLQFGGAMRSILGFVSTLIQASQDPADNNVQDVSAVTTDELVDLLSAQLSDVTPSNVGGALRLTRNAAGSGATMTLSGSIPGAPSGDVSFASLSASGGTGTAEPGTLNAGLRVSDGGSNVFMLAEDVTFDEDVLEATAYIRQVSGTTVAAAAIDTIVDDDLVPATIVGLSVTNADGTTAKPSSESGWAAVYQTALDTLLANTAPANIVNIVVAARHGVAGVAAGSLQGRIQKALTDHCIEASANGFLRSTPVSPPNATPKATARGSSGIGVASTTAGGRSARRWYAWPGTRKYVQELVQADPTSDGLVDWPSDIALGQLLSMLSPYLSAAEPTDYMRQVLDLESYYTAEGAGGALTPGDYITNKASGIISPVIDNVNGPVFDSQATSVNPAVDPAAADISERRTRDWIELALVNGVAKKQSKLNTPTRRRAVITDLNAFLKGLKDREEIANYVVRESTPASLKGKGVLVITVGVQTLDHLDNIIFSVTVGKTVDVKALA